MAAVDLSRRAFNKRVTVKMVAKAKNASGGHTESYPVEIETRAAVYEKGGTRVFDTGSMFAVKRKDFYLTYRSTLVNVDKDTRIEYNGKEYACNYYGFVDERKHILKIEGIGS